MEKMTKVIAFTRKGPADLPDSIECIRAVADGRLSSYRYYVGNINADVHRTREATGVISDEQRQALHKYANILLSVHAAAKSLELEGRVSRIEEYIRRPGKKKSDSDEDSDVAVIAYTVFHKPMAAKLRRVA